MRGLILTLCLLSTPASVTAQGDSASGRWPDLGSRVRVWTTSRRITGDLVNIRSDFTKTLGGIGVGVVWIR